MDLQTFQAAILPSRPKLYRFAMRFLGNIEEAEDTVQDVLMRMWNMRERLDAYRSVEALAMRITKNICLDKQKSKRSLQVPLDKQTFRLATASPTPERSTELSNARQMVELAIRQLPEVQQMIIQLRDVEEYEFEEIAEIMQADLNYIRVNLSRARKKLRELLTQLDA